MKKRVLIVIHTNTFFPELARVARQLSTTPEFEPIILFPHYYPTIQRDISSSLVHGWICLDGQARPIQKISEAPSRTFVGTSPRRQGVKRLLQRLGLEPLLKKLLKLYHDINHRDFDNFFFELWYLPRRTVFARRVIRQQQISLVVIGGDLVHYDTANFIQAAHREKIRAVIVPCTMSDEIEMADAYAPIKQYTARYFWNRVVAPFFPHWIYVHHGQKLLRLPAGRLLAMELLGLAPPKPWINLSGHADAIAAESQAMVDYYKRCGIPAEQLRLTGSLADDVMHQHIVNANAERRALYQKYKLPDRPMLLTAFPPNQLYMVGGRPECEFTSYDDLTSFWLETLASHSDRFNIIINLHPSLVVEDFRRWQKLGVTVVEENVTALIPLCNFFVASVSTIIRWAIAAGKPVVNYDVYRYRYNDYTSVPGVLTIESQREFKKKVKLVAEDSTYNQNISSLQKTAAPRWGNLDGQAGQRMIGLFNQIIYSNAL